MDNWLCIYCLGPDGFTAIYNGYIKLRSGVESNIYGGYSDNIVVKESFVLTIPETLDIKSAAPILCAGITTLLSLKTLGCKDWR